MVNALRTCCLIVFFLSPLTVVASVDITVDSWLTQFDKPKHIARNILVIDPELGDEFRDELIRSENRSFFYLDGYRWIDAFNSLNRPETWDGLDRKRQIQISLSQDHVDAVMIKRPTKSDIFDLFAINEDGRIQRVDSISVDQKNSLVREFFDHMEFDGILVDRKDDFLLIGLKDRDRASSQALLLADSSSSWSVKNKKGRALIQLIEKKGAFAIYEILLEKPNKKYPIRIGDKILTGQSSEIKKLYR